MRSKPFTFDPGASVLVTTWNLSDTGTVAGSVRSSSGEIVTVDTRRHGRVRVHVSCVSEWYALPADNVIPFARPLVNAGGMVA